MKPVNVNGLNPTQSARLQQPTTTRAGQLSSSFSYSSPDHVSVSRAVEEVGRLIARTGELPDVRNDRVDSLRDVIQSNQYQVSSSSIADAIIRDEAA